MNKNITNKYLSYSISSGLIWVSFIIAPWFTTEPYSSPKLLFQTGFSFLILVLLINNIKSLINKFNTVLIISLMLIIFSLIVFFSSSSIKYQQFYGVYGRNNGMLVLFSYVFYMIGAAVVSNKEYLMKFFKLTKIVGVVAFVYGLLQFFRLVTIKELQSKNELVIGFLGNINFQSAFLGIIGVIFFTFVVDINRSLKIKSLFSLLILLFLVEILLSKSQQGIYIFLSGVITVLFIKIYISNYKKIWLIFYLISVIIGVFTVFLGVINRGPLSGVIYEASITARRYYWQAGWNMTLAHPFFGVGFDGYGDWYRRSRTMESIEFLGTQDYSNAAHNVFLDVSSSGGFPLLIIYVSLVLYTALCGWRVIKRMKGFDAPFAAIFAGWVAYQVQSLVSINQIGLAIWGWVLSGLVIGYEINTRESTGEVKEVKEFKITKGVKAQALIGLVIGVLVASPPVVASYRMHSAFKSLDPNILKVATLTKPYEIKTMIDSAEIFRNNGYTEISLEIARTSVINFPDYFDAWYLLSLQANAVAEELRVARLQMQRLNPLLYK